MGRRTPLEAEDEVERRLLADIDARGSDGRSQAAAVLSVSRDVIDRMWSSSSGRPRREMRVAEARALASWLGYELDLARQSRVSTARQTARGRPSPRRAASSLR